MGSTQIQEACHLRVCPDPLREFDGRPCFCTWPPSHGLTLQFVDHVIHVRAMHHPELIPIQQRRLQLVAHSVPSANPTPDDP
jgi:hypothetical protein